MTQTVQNFRLGKQEYEHDAKTLSLVEEFVSPEIVVPATYDFDHNRSSFPLSAMGNDEWGNCVVCGEANQVLRLERIEQRRTIKLTDDDVITRYKALTGSQTPGDANDTGLVVLDALRDWRNNGFGVADKSRKYGIAAYGEINPLDPLQVRTAMYLFHGVQFGLWLPRAAQQMTGTRMWSYQGQEGPEWRPGSWGGHLVYGKRYGPDYVEVLSWGMKIKVSNAFIAKYCDEAWAVVDNFDTWRHTRIVDVDKLIQRLSEISSHVNE
jgi:hypothetical protein